MNELFIWIDSLKLDWGLIIGLLIGAATLKYTYRMYKDQRAEPWKLTKLEGDNWLLERISPIPATIVIKSILPESKGLRAVKQSYSSLFKVTVFKKGTKIILATHPLSQSPLGTIFSLCYEEHKIPFFIPKKSREGYSEEESAAFLQKKYEASIPNNHPVITLNVCEKIMKPLYKWQTRRFKIWESPLY